MRKVRCGCGHHFEAAGVLATCPKCGSVVRISREEEATSEYTTAGRMRAAQEKWRERVVGVCQACGNPVTHRLRETYGYYCSQECQERGRQLRPPLAEKERRVFPVPRRSTVVIGLSLAMVLALFVTSRALLRPGRVSWSFRSPSGQPLTELAYSPDFIYALYPSGEVHALNLKTGSQRWKAALDLAPDGFARLIAHATGCLFVTSNRVGLLDGQDGHTVWERSSPRIMTEVPPIVTGSRILYLSAQGSERPRSPEIEPPETLSPTDILDLEIPAPLRWSGTPGTISLHALDVATGRKIWQRTLGAGYRAMLAASEGSAYALVPGPKSKLYMVSIESGQSYQELDLPTGQAGKLHVAGDRLLISQATEIISLDTAGNASWRTVMQEPCREILALQGAKEIVTISGHFARCLFLEDGSEKWAAHVGQASGAAVIKDNLMYVASASDVFRAGPEAEEEEPMRLKAFDVRSGAVLWARKVPSPEFLPVGRALCFVQSKPPRRAARGISVPRYEILALDARTGSTRWRIQKDGQVRRSLVPYDRFLLLEVIDSKIVREGVSLFASYRELGPENCRIEALVVR